MKRTLCWQARRCTAMAVMAVMAAALGVVMPAPAAGVTDEQVVASMQKGIDFLLTQKKAAGIPAEGKIISATGRATKKVISRCRPPIIIRICAAKWCRP